MARKRKSTRRSPPLTIWTVGHSVRKSEEFGDLIVAHQIEAVADVRRFPGSRRHPQFARAALSDLLGRARVEYHAFEDLGGRRKPRVDSRNTGWRSAQFRGYADYMETTEYQEAIERLLALAAARRTAVMCAEALWWRCHRRLIADYLTAQGITVIHIFDSKKTEQHRLVEPARIIRGKLRYPSAGKKGVPRRGLSRLSAVDE